jgi:hypothetical protein
MPQKNEVQMQAECFVTSDGNTQIVRTHDKAWQMAMELPRPVEVSFLGLVRKDS